MYLGVQGTLMGGILVDGVLLVGGVWGCICVDGCTWGLLRGGVFCQLLWDDRICTLQVSFEIIHNLRISICILLLVIYPKCREGIVKG